MTAYEELPDQYVKFVSKEQYLFIQKKAKPSQKYMHQAIFRHTFALTLIDQAMFRVLTFSMQNIIADRFEWSESPDKNLGKYYRDLEKIAYEVCTEDELKETIRLALLEQKSDDITAKQAQDWLDGIEEEDRIRKIWLSFASSSIGSVVSGVAYLMTRVALSTVEVGTALVVGGIQLTVVALAPVVEQIIPSVQAVGRTIGTSISSGAASVMEGIGSIASNATRVVATLVEGVSYLDILLLYVIHLFTNFLVTVIGQFPSAQVAIINSRIDQAYLDYNAVVRSVRRAARTEIRYIESLTDEQLALQTERIQARQAERQQVMEQVTQNLRRQEALQEEELENMRPYEPLEIEGPELFEIEIQGPDLYEGEVKLERIEELYDQVGELANGLEEDVILEPWEAPIQEWPLIEQIDEVMPDLVNNEGLAEDAIENEIIEDYLNENFEMLGAEESGFLTSELVAGAAALIITVGILAYAIIKDNIARQKMQDELDRQNAKYQDEFMRLLQLLDLNVKPQIGLITMQTNYFTQPYTVQAALRYIYGDMTLKYLQWRANELKYGKVYEKPTVQEAIDRLAYINTFASPGPFVLGYASVVAPLPTFELYVGKVYNLTWDRFITTYHEVNEKMIEQNREKITSMLKQLTADHRLAKISKSVAWSDVKAGEISQGAVFVKNEPKFVSGVGRYGPIADLVKEATDVVLYIKQHDLKLYQLKEFNGEASGRDPMDFQVAKYRPTNNGRPLSLIGYPTISGDTYASENTVIVSLRNLQMVIMYQAKTDNLFYFQIFTPNLNFDGTGIKMISGDGKAYGLRTSLNDYETIVINDEVAKPGQPFVTQKLDWLEVDWNETKKARLASNKEAIRLCVEYINSSAARKKTIFPDIEFTSYEECLAGFPAIQTHSNNAHMCLANESIESINRYKNTELPAGGVISTIEAPSEQQTKPQQSQSEWLVRGYMTEKLTGLVLSFGGGEQVLEFMVKQDAKTVLLYSTTAATVTTVAYMSGLGPLALFGVQSMWTYTSLITGPSINTLDIGINVAAAVISEVADDAILAGVASAAMAGASANRAFYWLGGRGTSIVSNTVTSGSLAVIEASSGWVNNQLIEVANVGQLSQLASNAVFNNMFELSVRAGSYLIREYRYEYAIRYDPIPPTLANVPSDVLAHIANRVTPDEINWALSEERAEIREIDRALTDDAIAEEAKLNSQLDDWDEREVDPERDAVILRHQATVAAHIAERRIVSLASLPDKLDRILTRRLNLIPDLSNIDAELLLRYATRLFNFNNNRIVEGPDIVNEYGELVTNRAIRSEVWYQHVTTTGVRMTLAGGEVFIKMGQLSTKALARGVASGITSMAQNPKQSFYVVVGTAIFVTILTQFRKLSSEEQEALIMDTIQKTTSAGQYVLDKTSSVVTTVYTDVKDITQSAVNGYFAVAAVSALAVAYFGSVKMNKTTNKSKKSKRPTPYKKTKKIK